LTLDPAFISSLPITDPLFVAETNPALAELENTALLRSRSLILENIRGFENPPFFRGVPSLFNLQGTGPYGLSGDIPDIPGFTVGALQQHLTRTLNRVAGVDFRMPTQPELDALEAFQSSQFRPASKSSTVNSLAKIALQKKGRDLFFSATGGKCFFCHSGRVLAFPNDARPPFFDTGVVKLAINAGVLDGARLDTGHLGSGEFNVPQLFGVARTAPYFHDNSVATLREAVDFYNSVQFNTSPAAALVGGGGIVLIPSEVDAIVAFLQALDDR